MRQIRWLFIAPLMVMLNACAAIRSQANLGPNHQERSAEVEWVFNVPDQLVLNFGIIPAIEPGWVNAGAVADREVLLLCDLGAAAEQTRASRAFVLDLETGTLVKSMAGPPHASRYDWVITQRLLYIRVAGKRNWVGFDIERERIDPKPGFADPKDVLAMREGESGRDVGGEMSVIELQDGRIDISTWSVGNGRDLIVKRERSGGSRGFALKWKDTTGATRTEILCRFPVRMYESADHVVLVNDDRRLLFTWGAHVVCADVRNLNQAPASQAFPAANTQPEK